MRRYNGQANSNDEVTGIVVDRNGNIFVTGKSIGPQGNFDYLTIKYYPNDETAWVRRYNGTGNGEDVPTAIAVDNAGNCIVTGWSRGVSNPDYLTIKYTSSGDIAWIRRADINNRANRAYDVTVDGVGNVYVCGSFDAEPNTHEFWRIKYNPSGNEEWRVRTDPGGSTDKANKIRVDGASNVYVAGHENRNYSIVKYNSSGQQQWVRNYDLGGNDLISGLAIDNVGNIIVTGWGGAGCDYVTIKYNPIGETCWVRRYNGTGNGADSAFAIAVDPSGNVYVTGVSTGVGGTLIGRQ